MNRKKFIQSVGLLGFGATMSSFRPMEIPVDKSHKLKKIITVEEHFVIPNISAQVIQYLTKLNNGKSPISKAQTELMKIVLPDNDIAEVGEKRLSFMDKAGISTQVLSYGAGSPQNITDTNLAVTLCQQANNELAKIISQFPNRFKGFALLPMADTKEAEKELTRCINDLGFKGAMISGTLNGTFFDEQRFRPVFAKATELNVPIYLHPAVIENPISNYYYQSENWTEVAHLMFASAGFGWHVDSGIALIRLIMSGIFDQYPDLQIISGHWGELVPFYLNRLDDQQAKTLNLERTFTDYFKQNIYITPSGFFNENQLQYCINEIGADRIIYSCDYPFLKDENTKKFLEDCNISESKKKKIAFQNAEKLFKL